MNFKYIVIHVGDLIKWDSSVKEINRATTIFQFSRDLFPNEEGVTSERAKLFYDWVMTLFVQNVPDEKKKDLLYQFCLAVTNESQRDKLENIFKIGGAKLDKSLAIDNTFNLRNFHPEIHRHSKNLFNQKNYFHAVFEGAKAYNVAVKQKSKSIKDGQDLMLTVWGAEKGVLKVTPCVSDTDKNVQDGLKSLSAGLMSAIRNPTAHEPALDWPIDKEDCLDILNFISYLFRQLDKATYFNPNSSNTP